MCRKVHEGRVFLKGTDVGTLIGRNTSHIKNNKYINGHQLHDIHIFEWEPVYKQVPFGIIKKKNYTVLDLIHQ